MLRFVTIAALLLLPSPRTEPSRLVPLTSTTTTTWTGWFSDKQCARVREDEEPRPNGTACVKKCLSEGLPAVFISEQARAVYEVRDYPAAKEDVGFRLEIVGIVDQTAKTVSIKSVTRLSEVTAMCVVPKKRRS